MSDVVGDVVDDSRPLLSGIGEDPPRRGHQFTVVLRGYDRAEVDAYFEAVDVELARLQELVAGLDERIRTKEAEHRAELDALRARDEVERPSLRGFGERVALVLTSAEAEAEALRAGARADVDRQRAWIRENVERETAAARREAQQRLDAVRAQTDATRAEADELFAAATAAKAAAQQEADVIREQAAQVRRDADEAASALVVDAQRRSQAAVTEAEVRAAGIVDEARAKAREEEDAARARLEVLAREHQELLARLGTIRDAVAGLTGQAPPADPAVRAADSPSH